ncbi:FAD-binding monooxygenase [Actinomadura fulvescens]|uniref:FAD-binding monooxygenase n=1 Tax=Actinomadura fulvescens TaxID=46160 RepID=A0ABN3PQA6_9ACTN
MDMVRATLGGRAVVLGGGIAGLLAARVLADAYEEVLVLDRDTLAGVTTPRRGVPHGHHVHGVLARGHEVLCELYPGFEADLVNAGVPIGDFAADLRWYVNGRRLPRVHSGLVSLGSIRPVLEAYLRDRTAALPNVKLVERCDILEPVATPAGDRIVGVRVRRDTAGGAAEVLHTDLLVDATGRGSRLPAWLAGLGHQRPEEQRIKVGLAYTTRNYRLRSDPYHGDLTINLVPSPRFPRGAYFQNRGDGTAMLTLTGMLGDHPPADPDGFLAFARSLAVPDIHAALLDADPLDDPVTFRFPASLWRRYDRMDFLPDRMLAVGDAVCSFNPVYGQGMTVAALEALALRAHLRSGAPPTPRRFFRDITGVIETQWRLSAAGDLSFPGVEGHRTMQIRLGNAYMRRLQEAALRDAMITKAFFRVIGLVDPPQAIMRPAIVLRVLRSLARRRTPVPAPTLDTRARPGHRV